MTFIENLRQDLRYALRMLRRSPGFATVALLSLALGIGANTAIFQLLNAVRLRNLPVNDPQELAAVRVAGGNRGLGITTGYGSDMTYPLWEHIRDEQQAFSGVFALGSFQIPMGVGTETQAVDSLWMTGGLFNVLGLNAEKGRLLNPADDRPGCGLETAVISHAFWQRHFGGEDAAIGKTLTVLDRPVQVIGVTPRDFVGLEVGKKFDVAFPLCAEPVLGGNTTRPDIWWLTVMGRLKPGWTLQRAAAHLDTISPGIFDATVWPGYENAVSERYRKFRLTAEGAANGTSRLRARFERPLWLLLGITGLVLLIASVNLANLMLARASAREREIAVRVAIGASRWRLVSQLSAESLLLACIGMVFAIGLTPLLSRALAGFLNTEDQAVILNLALDWRLLLFTAGVAVLTCVSFGLVPAFRSSQIEPGAAMKAAGRGLTAGKDRFTFQRVLVVVQIAVSLVLLFGALLFVQSLRNLTTLDAGFRRSGIVFATAAQPVFRVPPAERPAFQARLLEDIRSIPQVESAALSTHMPLVGSMWSFIVRVMNSQGEKVQDARFTYISPDYFRTMETPMLQGRDFNQFDTANSRKVAIVNESFVRIFVPNQNPIGTLIRTVAEPDFPEAVYEVVGVVKDTKYTSLRDYLPPITYVPHTQNPQPSGIVRMVVRFSEPGSQVLAGIKRRISESQPEMSVQLKLVETLIRDGLTLERLMAWLSGSFGALAALLAMVGLYGVMSYMVQRRKNEMGIRIALGSSRGRVMVLIGRETALLVLVGVALGAVLSLALTRAMGALLFELSPGDPRTLIAAAAVLAVIAAIASGVPALRASRVDPMVALRHE
jgi:putative ABC transport system permease protein